MEVRQARFFLTIADQQSMVRAAEVLHITQPALSQALLQLERELKVELFQRTSRGMRLSEAGKALLDPARRLSDASRLADASVQIDTEHVSGDLVVAATPAFAASPLSSWVAQFRKLNPEVVIHIVPYSGDDPIERILDHHGVDLVLAHYEREIPDHVIEFPIGREEMVLTVPADDDPFDDGPVHLHELADRPLILSPEKTSMHTVVTEAFAHLGITPQLGVETSFMDSFVPLTTGGAGWSILPRQHITATEGHGIRVHPLTPAPFRTFSFYCRGRGAPVAVPLFLNLARTLQRV